MAKQSYTQSHLANPATPIHRLAAKFQDYLHFPDPYPLYVLMAALVGNMAQARSPIWLMLVGPPACGKSELLQSLLSVDNIISGGAISGLGALLSGTKKKEKTVASTGGLLREIGDRGGLVIKEFNSILSLPKETMKQVTGAFREIYDGRWDRPIGTEGARHEVWQGKIGVFAGCTETIDAHAAQIQDMGERFVYFRYPKSDGWSEALKALTGMSNEDLTTDLQAIVLDFAAELGLDWQSPVSLPDLDLADKIRLVAFAQFSANSRSSVTRDQYTREITATSSSEFPTRIALVLGQFLKAARYIGIGEKDCWQLIRRVSLDSLPLTRRLCVSALLQSCETVIEIACHTRISEAATRRSLEELAVHGVVSNENITGNAHWSLSVWALDRLKEAMGKRATGKVDDETFELISKHWTS